MGRKVKQLKNYTTEQVEALFESNENYRIGVKLYAVLQLTRGYSSRALEEFFRTSFTCTPYEVRVNKFVTGRTGLMQKALVVYVSNRVEGDVRV